MTPRVRLAIAAAALALIALLLMLREREGEGARRLWVEVREDGTFERKGLRPGPVRPGWWAHGSKIAGLGEVVAPAGGVVLRVPAP